MLPTNFIYNQLIEKGDALCLYDSQFVNARALDIEALQSAYKSIRETLERFDYPTGENWLRAIAEGGAEALSRVLVEENDKEAKRMKVPAFMAKQWRKSVVDDAPRDLYNEADSLHVTIEQKRGELPIKEGDVTFKDGNLVVDADAIMERIKDIATREITPQMQKEAQMLKETVIKVRELQEGGLYALDVVKKYAGNWLAPSRYPDMEDTLELYNTLLSRRHISREQIKLQSPEWYYLNGGE